MNLQNRVGKLERETSAGDCECAKFENARVILPDDGRGDAAPRGDERCKVCGEERLTIRVVYADQRSHD